MTTATTAAATSATIEIRAREAGFLADLVSVAGRAIRRLPREPETIIPALIIPVFFYVVNVGALGSFAEQAGAVDVGAACTGLLSALELAGAAIEAGRARSALVIGAEVLSRVIDYDDRRTAGLFGDGAGAAVVTPDGPGRIGPVALRSDGGRGDLIQATHDERLIRMDGRATFRAAVAAMSDVTREVVSNAGLSLDGIDLFVYHQANSRIIQNAARRLALQEGTVFTNLEYYGNTSAASIAIALCEAVAEGRLHPGQLLALAEGGIHRR